MSFPSPEVRDPAFGLGAGDGAVLAGVEPERWTDTEIDVIVPQWATTGELRLNGFTRVEEPCATIDVFRLGNAVLFLGGLAAVFEVRLGGKLVDLTGKELANLTPSDGVALTYRGTGSPSVRVKVQLVDESGLVLRERSGLPGGYGGFVLLVPDPAPRRPRLVTLVLTPTSDCGATQPLRILVSLSVPPVLTIEYVEVTQGVQGDLGDVLSGHAMPSVANKDTAVRVHLNCDRGGWYENALDRITGVLLVDGRALAPTNARPSIPDLRFAAVKGRSRPDNTNETLNFTIPAGWLSAGTHSLTVRVACDDQSGKIALGQTISWAWVAKPPLAVRALYLSNRLNVPNDVLLDFVRRALDYLPTSLAAIGIAAPTGYPQDLDLWTDESWSHLLDKVEDMWDDWDEDSGVRWLGIVPVEDRHGTRAGIAGTPGVVALATADRPDIGAHELGHTLGLHHVNLASVGAKNGPDGPFDDADSGGRLRRPPFDVRSSTAIPLPAGDLMSYFEPIRPGISTWVRLYNIL